MTEEQKVQLKDVATQTETRFVLPDGTETDLYGYLEWLGNRVNEISKNVE